MKFDIPLMRPNITEEDFLVLRESLRSGNLVQGSNVEHFEHKMAEYIGVNYSFCVSSGTAALHLALLSLGVGPGDEVIIPAFSFIATANVVELVGATPIFIDIDINTFNINTLLIEEKICKRTKLIMPVHEFGLAADMSEVNAICEKHNLYCIEDAACAIGAKEDELFTGNMSEIGAFSFHPRKSITSGEGGLLTTNSKKHASFIKAMRNHGLDFEDGKSVQNYAGLNYRMTDFQAAMLISQFNRFDENLSRKQWIADRYISGIKNSYIKLPNQFSNRKSHSWQTFHVLFKNQTLRDKFIRDMKSCGIQTNFGAHSIPHTNFYKQKYFFNCNNRYPNALEAHLCGAAIPIYELLSDTEVDYIIKTINNWNP